MTSTTVRVVIDDGSAFSAYLSSPQAVPAPVVVVLQEIFGINRNIRQVCDTLAASGFYAIAPDLFWRQEPGVELDPGNPADRTKATALMNGMDSALAVEDAMVAARYALALPGSNGKLGVVGYCMGGRLAYLMSTQPGVRAAISYYGVGIQAALDLAGSVKAHLLLHLAGDDQLCPPAAQRDIVEAMEPYRDHVRVEIHPGVGHAFARFDSPARDEEAARRADEATITLLAEELRA